MGLRSVFEALVLKLGGSVAQFALTVLVGRLLGSVGSGAYFLGISVVMFASVLSRAGLDGTLVRFIAAGREIGEWAWVRAVYRQAVSLSLGLSVIAGALLWFGSDWLATQVFSEAGDPAVLRAMAWAVPAFSLVFLHGEAFKAVGDVRWSQLAQSVCIPIFACGFLVVLAGRGNGVSASDAAAVYSAAVWVVLGLSVSVFLGRSARLGTAEPEYAWGRMFRASAPILLVAVLNVLNLWAGTAALGIWGTAEEVGVYSAANRVAALVSLILYAFDAVNGPRFAKLWAGRDRSRLATAARTSAGLMAAAAVPVVAVFCWFGSALMSVFGPDFVAGAPFLCVLAIGQLVNVGSGSVGYLLIMSGHERSLRNVAVVAVFLQIVLQVVLTPRYGAMGAAVATAISQAAMNLLAVVTVRRHLEFWPVPLLGSRD